MGALVEDALHLESRTFREAGIEIVGNFHDSATATLPGQKLMRVVIDILRNAVDAIHEHSDVLRNREEKGRITVGLRVAGNEVIISISDNGCGISRKDLTRVFGHGYTTKLEHHGFGLHNVANRVAEMRGDVSLDSQGVGRGVIFEVRLPTDAA